MNADAAQLSAVSAYSCKHLFLLVLCLKEGVGVKIRTISLSVTLLQKYIPR